LNKVFPSNTHWNWKSSGKSDSDDDEELLVEAEVAGKSKLEEPIPTSSDSTNGDAMMDIDTPANSAGESG
jgi:hypothetical protein